MHDGLASLRGQVADVLGQGLVAAALHLAGATPVFVDCERDSWCIEPALLAAELERRHRTNRLPKAVIAVDLYGQRTDYDRIASTCAEHGVLLVVDAAEAIGATHRGRRAGSLGDIDVFSFNGNKLITTRGGVPPCSTSMSRAGSDRP